ncbi:MAG TPA: tetratricopeptide repeat protein [Candidatus Deferrimicrobium sp.]|nr:tetratricopeptide repeat protein [Candidatus Deferrimicrobium sp.]
MMCRNLKYLFVAVLFLALLTAGCSQSFYMQGRKHLNRGEHDPAIESFYKEISANPTSAEAWRELGVAYYEKGDLAKAEDALKQASGIRPDARTHLFLGLLYEKGQDYTRAIDAYSAALGLQPRGKQAAAIRAHLDRLISRKIESDIAVALKNESQINPNSIPENTIAVGNFDASHLPPELAPIARGLAEFTSIDLAKVEALTVLERLKLDMLLHELQLGTTGYVDPASAPRLGLLMGTRKLVTGTVVGIGDEGLKLDGAIVNTTDGATARPEGSEGQLKKFFKVQKEFVLKIIDELGITLSAAERDSIMEVPTESYLAFLAYCRGLDYRSQGMYSSAEQEFRKAVEIDGNFQQAETQLQSLVNRPVGTVNYEQSFADLEQAARQEGLQPQATTGLDSRLTSVAQHSGTIPAVGGGPVLVLPLSSQPATVIVRGDLD